MNQKVRQVIAEHAQLPADLPPLEDQTNLYEVGMASRASVNMMLALESVFEIEFPDSMLNRAVFESIAAISEAVEELLG
ncbi:MAG: acyl carrier protein [Planctomycetes bacterium]|nr:acyl carrier protein [Planctomycetota bacterium]